MAVEAVVALMVEKLDKLLTKEAQLLGVHGEIKHIRQELNQMRRFLKDADIKQKEDEDVRDWMEDIRDICFDVDDVIDILGQGQAAQGRHGFVERLKGRISDQITRYKVGKEIERIKLNIKGISRRRESYRITETSSTQRLQEVSRCSVPPEKIEKVNSRVDDQLTRDIDEGRLEAQATGQFSTRLGESEEVGLQEEINRVSEQLTKEEPSHCDGTRDIDEGRLEAQVGGQFSSRLGESEEVGSQEEINSVSDMEEPSHCDGTRDIDKGRLEDWWFRTPWEKEEEEEEARARARAREEEARKRRALEKIIDFAPRLQELSRRSVTPEKIEKPITRVDDQLTNDERTRDIDEGRQEASSSSRNLQAHRPISTLPGEPEEVALQEEINRVGQELIEEEPRLWDGTRDISEGKLTASSSTPGLKADRVFSTLLGDSEDVGLQEGINTVGQQLIKEKPSHCDDTSGIDEVPECRDGSKKRKRQPEWSEQVRVSSGCSLEDPPDDGHHWKKYGQKHIRGERYPRAYYKCADKSFRCLAKKRVQRSDEDPSIFCIQYQGLHTCLETDRVFSTLLGHSEDVGLQEEINTVGQQLIKEKPSHCDDTSGIDEVPECREGSKKREMQPKWSEQVRGNTQIAGKGNNPQVQGNTNAGTGGNVNLGFQDKKGNTQIGGGGHNPQVQGYINAGTGGNVNLGFQDKKGNTQIAGKGNNPQVQGNTNAGTGGNVNLKNQVCGYSDINMGNQGANVDLENLVSGGGNINMGNQEYGGGNANIGTQE